MLWISPRIYWYIEKLLAISRKSVSSDIKLFWSWLKNLGLQLVFLFQPTPHCLDIWWNTIPCVRYITSNTLHVNQKRKKVTLNWHFTKIHANIPEQLNYLSQKYYYWLQWTWQEIVPLYRCLNKFVNQIVVWFTSYTLLGYSNVQWIIQ